jgi:hypothetical protein
VGLRSEHFCSFPRTLFLGSRLTCQPLPAGSRAMGPTRRKGEVSHLAVRRATGGDLNPDCLGLFCPVVSGGLDRWPPIPAVPAFCCFARPRSSLGTGLLVWEPFPFSQPKPLTASGYCYFGRLRFLMLDLDSQPVAFGFCLLQQNLPAVLSSCLTTGLPGRSVIQALMSFPEGSGSVSEGP